jgi:hypothetical protein
VQDQHPGLGFSVGRLEVRVRKSVALAYFRADVGHNSWSMAYAAVAIILFVLMLYMARRGLRS